MGELTTGDQRFIDEATANWDFLIKGILSKMTDVPGEVTSRINGLRDRYIEEFGTFFREAKEADTEETADELLGEFDRKWHAAHPEFYDMKALFSGCSDTDMENAGDAFRWADGYIN